MEGPRTATVDDVSLAFREHGGGEPAVLVHGAASGMRASDRQMPAASPLMHEEGAPFVKKAILGFLNGRAGQAPR